MKFLFPLAWIYGGVMAVRNWMFDNGLLSQTHFDLPIIAVGNLAVGGTGKTPHTEYILRWLTSQGRRCAMLSRGYGRKTKGFYEVQGRQPQETGDEPWQVQRKFPEVRVCVCEKRVEGIRRMLSTGAVPEVVVLDDAFQHRYVQPGLSILLTDYSRPYYSDYVMPAGRLREFRKGARRAQVILVTKCPETLSDKEQKEMVHRIKPLPNQEVFFTRFVYGDLYPFSDTAEESAMLSNSTALLLCGIARPENLICYLQPQCKLLEVAEFTDHHNFTKEEIEQLAERAVHFDRVITTEKDAARLSGYSLPQQLSERLWVQPIEVQFLNNEYKKFNKIITDYVTENSRNSTVD